MKTRMARIITNAVVVLAWCAIGAAGDRVIVIDKTHSDPKRIGGFVGGVPTPALNTPTVVAPASLSLEEDWREYEGQIYNVAVKRRWTHDWAYQREMKRRGITMVLPGWENIFGRLVHYENGTAEIVVGARRARSVVVRDFPQTEAKRLMGKPTDVYAHRSGTDADVYEYGKPVSASEAQRILNAKSAKSAKTNEVQAAEKK